MDGEEALREQLDQVDGSLSFLLLIVASVLLSLWTVTIQRQALCRTLTGEEGGPPLPDPLPIRRGASALLVGGLGFFLAQAARTWREACAEGRPAEARSALTGLWASLLVLLAAILRFRDLKEAAAAGGQDIEGGAP